MGVGQDCRGGFEGQWVSVSGRAYRSAPHCNGSPACAVGSQLERLGKLTTTDSYLNARRQPVHELNERKPLTLVKS